MIEFELNPWVTTISNPTIVRCSEFASSNKHNLCDVTNNGPTIIITIVHLDTSNDTSTSTPVTVHIGKYSCLCWLGNMSKQIQFRAKQAGPIILNWYFLAQRAYLRGLKDYYFDRLSSRLTTKRVVGQQQQQYQQQIFSQRQMNSSRRPKYCHQLSERISRRCCLNRQIFTKLNLQASHTCLNLAPSNTHNQLYAIVENHPVHCWLFVQFHHKHVP